MEKHGNCFNLKNWHNPILTDYDLEQILIPLLHTPATKELLYNIVDKFAKFYDKLCDDKILYQYRINCDEIHGEDDFGYQLVFNIYSHYQRLIKLNTYTDHIKFRTKDGNDWECNRIKFSFIDF